ncbi:putative CD8+ T cell target antigen Tp2 [Toxoplasma gondii VAND]|uniref:Putative CD8+ T cell target antigen Tp2 n=1 Tax=Toxoplasma gondii VAND TaxID=933077 RepID=A0A086PRF5_TOXGO|nr:putative CD8+ T cell target antigen Tp2 [Toxoplasma gondii VAND]
MRNSGKLSTLGLGVGAVVLLTASAQFLVSSGAASDFHEAANVSGHREESRKLLPAEFLLWGTNEAGISVAEQPPMLRKRTVIFFSRGGSDSLDSSVLPGTVNLPHSEDLALAAAAQANSQFPNEVTEARNSRDEARHRGIRKDAEGCLSPTDQHIITGNFLSSLPQQLEEPSGDSSVPSRHPSTLFYEILFSCGRRAFGNEERTTACVQHELGVQLGYHLTTGCMRCFAKSVACTAANCRGVCMLDSCAERCLQCSEDHCKTGLLACTELSSVPPPCVEDQVASSIVRSRVPLPLGRRLRGFGRAVQLSYTTTSARTSLAAPTLQPK